MMSKISSIQKVDVKSSRIGTYRQKEEENAGATIEPSTGDLASYAAPALASCLLYTPLWVILPAIYAKYFGLELTTVAAVVFYGRLFDGITDPTVGYLSDRHRIAGGSRKVWVMFGGLGMIISSYFLFSPPDSITASYYLIWSFAFFLAFTMMDVPHLAWGSELTLNYNQRAKVFNTRAIFWGVGSGLFYLLPLLPIYESNEFTPEVLIDLVYVSAVIMICVLMWAQFYAPEGFIVKSNKKDTFSLLVRSVVQNKPFLIYLAGFNIITLSLGMWWGLLFIFLDSYLSNSGLLAGGFLFGIFVGSFCIPLWQKLTNKTSKSVVWISGMLVFYLVIFCFLFVSPGDPDWITFVLLALGQVGLYCFNAMAFAILGDIVDYGTFKFQQNRGSTYFSVNSFCLKIALGGGGGISLGLAGYFDFDPSSSVQSEIAIFGLNLGFIYLPLLLGFLGLIFVFFTPITKRRHGIIGRRISQRIQSNSKYSDKEVSLAS